MISFFFQISISGSIEINKKTYANYFGKKHNKAIFAYIWDNKIDSSQQFINQWSALSDAEEYNEHITFVDVPCHKNTELCLKFETEKIPSLIWYENSQSPPNIYNGKLVINEITAFLRNVTASPIIKLTRGRYARPIKEQIQSALNTDINDGEYFIFNISSSDKDSIKIAKDMATKFKYLPAQFFLYKDKSMHAPYLTSHKGAKTFKLNEQFDDRNIEAFIIRRNIPLLAQYTNTISDISFNYKIPIAIFVKPNEFGPKIEPYAEVIENYMAVTQTNCILTPSICSYVNQKPKDYGYIAIVNRSSYTFWIYDKPLDEKYIDSMVEDIVNHQMKGYGPGIWIRPFVKAVNFYYSLRERGGMPFYTIEIPLCFATILFCFAIWYKSDSIVFYTNWFKSIQEEKRKRREYQAELERQKKNRLNLKNR